MLGNNARWERDSEWEHALSICGPSLVWMVISISIFESWWIIYGLTDTMNAELKDTCPPILCAALKGVYVRDTHTNPVVVMVSIHCWGLSISVHSLQFVSASLYNLWVAVSFRQRAVQKKDICSVKECPNYSWPFTLWGVSLCSICVLLTSTLFGPHWLKTRSLYFSLCPTILLSLHAKELWILPRNLFLDSLLVSQIHVFFNLLLSLPYIFQCLFEILLPSMCWSIFVTHSHFLHINIPVTPEKSACLEYCKTDSCGHNHTLNIILQNPTGSNYNRSHTHTTIICTWDITLAPNKGVCFFVWMCVRECALLLQRQRLLFTVLLHNQPMRTTNHWSVSEVT